MPSLVYSGACDTETLVLKSSMALQKGKLRHVCHSPDVRSNIHFHHSLVISICDANQHYCDGTIHIRLAEEAPTTIVVEPEGSVPAPVVAQPLEDTLDLHTDASLIGTEALDISLKDLGIGEETVNGILNLYAVIRRPDGGSYQVGLTQVYRFAKCWVQPIRNQGLKYRNSHHPRALRQKKVMPVSCLI